MPVEKIATAANRSAELDTAKGLLMLVVVFGHAIQFFGHGNHDSFWHDPLFKLIYMFHMPLFMAYSGYLSSQRTATWSTVSGRLMALIYPMLPWVLILATLKGVANRDMGSVPMLTLSGFLGTYWFLWAAFLSFLIVTLTTLVKPWALTLQILAFGILLLVDKHWSVLPMLLLVFPFYVAGRLFKAQQPTRLHTAMTHPAWAIPLAAVSGLCFMLWEPNTYIYNNKGNFWQHGEDMLLMLTGALTTTALAAFVFWWASRAIVLTPVGRWFQKLGQITLEIYLVQGLMFAISMKMLHLMPSVITSQPMVRWLVTLLLSVLMVEAIRHFVKATQRNTHLMRFLWWR